MATGSSKRKSSGRKATLTKGCQRVLKALEKSHELTSAQDIHAKLRAQESKAPGLTTVYRSLESLESLGLVQAVDLGDGERRYEAVEPGQHHHHLVCQRCNEHIHLDKCLVHDIEDAVRQKYGFEIESHVLELFGTCTQCTKTRSK